MHAWVFLALWCVVSERRLFRYIKEHDIDGIRVYGDLTSLATNKSCKPSLYFIGKLAFLLTWAFIVNDIPSLHLPLIRHFIVLFGPTCIAKGSQEHGSFPECYIKCKSFVKYLLLCKNACFVFYICNYAYARNEYANLLCKYLGCNYFPSDFIKSLPVDAACLPESHTPAYPFIIKLSNFTHLSQQNRYSIVKKM